MESTKIKMGDEIIEIPKLPYESKLAGILRGLHTIYALTIVRLYEKYGDGVLEEASKVWYEMGLQAGEEIKKLAMKKSGKTEMGIEEYFRYGPYSIEGMGFFDIGLELKCIEATKEKAVGRMINCPFLRIWKSAGIKDEKMIAKLCKTLYPFDEAFIKAFNPKMKVLYSCDKPGFEEGKDYCQIEIELKDE
ncbi:MAG: hypothetical protein D6734_03090 [Candidatus Schekmanbacteria bacterium]|nr:MAG: hypothetical protein D6734_03090 [Candidatus Schekmanbacteria bacterium]